MPLQAPDRYVGSKRKAQEMQEAGASRKRPGDVPKWADPEGVPLKRRCIANLSAHASAHDSSSSEDPEAQMPLNPESTTACEASSSASSSRVCTNQTVPFVLLL